MGKEKFYQGYVQVEHDQDFDSSGNPIAPHVHRVDINPYDVPPDDLPEGYTPRSAKPLKRAFLWECSPPEDHPAARHRG